MREEVIQFPSTDLFWNSPILCIFNDSFHTIGRFQRFIPEWKYWMDTLPIASFFFEIPFDEKC